MALWAVWAAPSHRGAVQGLVGGVGSARPGSVHAAGAVNHRPQGRHRPQRAYALDPYGVTSYKSADNDEAMAAALARSTRPHTRRPRRETARPSRVRARR